MHIPEHFAEDRVEVLHRLIREHAFATLLIASPDGLVADHLPMLVKPEPKPWGTLQGHVARANPVWRALADIDETLVVFQGPQSYISPSWYPTKRETGKAVPTWNYIVVHGRGVPRAIEDEAWLRNHVEELTRANETARPEPWQVSDAPEDFAARLVRAIVGIEVPLASLVGKWKLGQNRPAVDRAGMRAGLAEEEGAAARELLAWLEGDR